MNQDDNSPTNPINNSPRRHGKVLQPLSDSLKPARKGANEAVELLRKRVDSLYDSEPDAQEEIIEAEAAGSHRSKHQQFMYELSNSGKSLAEIQSEWHDYYVQLSNEEKHEVWQEFYTNHGDSSVVPGKTNKENHPKPTSDSKSHPAEYRQTNPLLPTDTREPETIQENLKTTIVSRAKTQAKPSRAKSLLFGLGMGAIVVVISLFGLFNERVIAPFITPSKNVTNTPLIIETASNMVSPEPKLIIPKINVEVPVIFDEPSIKEEDVQRALEEGVLHYATTPDPGEKGNGAIFGHSSNNILNRGKYKFAFALLHRLEEGDTFMVHKDSKRYVYRVYKKSIVKPTDVHVLDPQEKSATMTLITCDPPGTNTNRLVIVGEQINPDPVNNVASSAIEASETPTLPSDSPSLWERLTGWL